MKKMLLVLSVLICFGCESSSSKFTIVDKSLEIKDFSCAEMLEHIYTDGDEGVYLPCIKSDYVVVRMKDGSEINIADALKDKIVKVEDLDKFDIKYYKMKIRDEYE